MSFHYNEAIALVFQICVGKTGISQPLYASNLEVREVVGVVRYALRVDL